MVKSTEISVLDSAERKMCEQQNEVDAANDSGNHTNCEGKELRKLIKLN